MPKRLLPVITGGLMALLAHSGARADQEPLGLMNLRASDGLRLDALRQRSAPKLDQAQTASDAAPAIAEPDVSDRTCLSATSLRVDGASLIPPDELRGWIQAVPVNAGCVAAGDVNGLLFKISSWYLQHGYITSQPVAFAVDEQGALVIQVMQGRLDKIVSADSRISTRGLISNPQAVLNLRDIEQAVSQINRLETRQVAVDVEPGEHEGTSVLNLRPRTALPERDWLLQTTVDNHDADQIKGTLDLSLDNKLGWNENIYLAHSRELTKRDLMSRSYSALISVPNAYSTYSASIFTRESASPLSWGESVTSDRTSVSLKWEHVLHRSQSTIASSFVDLVHDESKLRIGDISLRLSSWSLAYASTGVTVEHQDDAWGGSVTLKVDQGLGGSKEGENEPDDGYTATSLRAALRKPLAPGWTAAAQFQVQHSAHFVPGFQQFWIGGTTLVPGFRYFARSGNSGGIAQMQLSYMLPRVALGADEGDSVAHMLSLLHTTGWVFEDEQNYASRLSSATIQYMARWRSMSLLLAWSAPLDGGREGNAKRGSDVSVLASYRY